MSRRQADRAGEGVPDSRDGVSTEITNSPFGRGVPCRWSVNWDTGSDGLEPGHLRGKVRCPIREASLYPWPVGSPRGP